MACQANSSPSPVVHLMALLLAALAVPVYAADELPDLSDRTADYLSGLPNDSSVKTLNIADFDNNGLTDIIVARRGMSPVLLMNENGELVNRTSDYLGSGATADDSTYVEAFDANNDGFMDLAFAVLNEPVRMFLNRGMNSGSWSGFDQGWDVPFATNALTIESGDIRGDGTADDLLVNQVMDNNVMLLNNGTGHFVNGSSHLDTLETLIQGHFVLVEDANADGVDDIIHIEADDNLFVYYNDGNGFFSHDRRKSFQNTNFGQPLAYTCGCGDYNGDGIFDFAVHADGGGDDRLTSFMSTGVVAANGLPEHVFVDQPGVPRRVSRRHGLGHNGDIDGDGDLDYVQSSLERVHGTLDLRPIGVRTLIVINTGVNSGVFVGHSVGDWAQQDSHDMKFIDVNADGNLDLFVGHDSRYGVYINNAPPIEIELDNNIVSTPTQTGDMISLEATLLSGVATTYTWEFGDGTTQTTSVPEVQHTYATAGSYSITLTASGPRGSDQLNFKQIIHNPLTSTAPLTSSGMVYQPRSGADDRVFVANPDHDSVTVLSGTTGQVVGEVAVGTEPRSLALGSSSRLYVVNKGSATLTVVNTDNLQVLEQQSLPYASRPHGIVLDTQLQRAYIALEARNEVLQWDVAQGTRLGVLSTGAVPRELAMSADRSTLYAPVFITQPLPGEGTRSVGTTPGAEVLVINPQSMSLTSTINIAVNAIDEQEEDAEISSRGVPNYLRAPVISPDGLTAIVPAKIDNIYRGLMRDGRARAHDKLVRGAMLKLDTQNNTERFDERLDFDNNSAPTALAFGPTGNFIFSVHESSRAFEIIDAHTHEELYRTTTEFAPRSVVASPDGSRVFIHNYLSRSVSILDTESIMTGLQSEAELVGVTALMSNERLAADVLRGKQLFHDSEDNRLSTQGYIACASCHDDAGHDGRVWDFSDAGEGLRNTIDLRGRAATGDGNVHWSANFDEFHDFENDIREIFDGTGLMSDADFAASAAPLDAANPKAGRSTDLDALAAFGASLNTYHQSPYRNSDGQLTTEGARGREVFIDYNCADCHEGTSFTDSPAGSTHDIGTIDIDTGGRLGMPLLNGGLDTPTLRGLWDGAPYLHDGSAGTLGEAVSAHTENLPVAIDGMSDTELEDLVSYLMQIDGNEPSAPEGLNPGITAPSIAGAPSNVVNGGSGIALSVTDLTIDDWASIPAYPEDPANAFTGNNTLDLRRLWLAHDETHLFVRYETVNAVVDTWGLSVHFDTDNNRDTGYTGSAGELPIGVDYMIEGRILYQYSGTGSNFSWTAVQELEEAIIDTNREMRVSRLAMGNPVGMRLFLYANNEAVGGSHLDAYPDTAVVEDHSLGERSLTYDFGRAVDITVPPSSGGAGVVARHNYTQNIVLDGDLSDWQALESFGEDANDIDGTANSIDWLETWMANSNTTTYLAWRNDGQVSISWGNGIMLDTDQDIGTGYVGFLNNLPIGIEVLIEHSSVYRYTGSGLNWSWEYVGEVDIALGTHTVELAFPSSYLGNVDTVDLFFIGNNAAVGGAAVDYFPDNVNGLIASGGSRFVRYAFIEPPQNSARSTRQRSQASVPVSHTESNAGSVGGLWLLLGITLLAWRLTWPSRVRRCFRPLQDRANRQRCAGLAMVVLLSACDSGVSVSNGTSGGNSTPAVNQTGDRSQPLNNPSMPDSARLSAAVSVPGYISAFPSIRLSGSLINPPVSTRARGVASVKLNTATGKLSGSVSHSVTGATQSSIRIGKPGENGDPIVTLTRVDQNEFVVPENTMLSEEQLAHFRAGNLYVVVDSGNYIDGEIRGQISTTPSTFSVAPNLEEIQAKVLGPTCSGCHFGGGETLPSSSDFTSATSSYNSLVNFRSKQDPNKMRVLPGVPEESYLIDKLTGLQSVGSQMPFRGVPLDARTIEAINRWIADGAER